MHGIDSSSDQIDIERNLSSLFYLERRTLLETQKLKTYNNSIPSESLWKTHFAQFYSGIHNILTVYLKIHRGTDTYYFDDLRQFQTHFDRQPVRVVADGSDESVVVAQQIVVKPFGVGASVHGRVRHSQLADNDRGEYGANDFHRWKKKSMSTLKRSNCDWCYNSYYHTVQSWHWPGGVYTLQANILLKTVIQNNMSLPSDTPNVMAGRFFQRSIIHPSDYSQCIEYTPISVFTIWAISNIYFGEV